MKPSSILLLAAAGLSSAMPAPKDTRSLFGHAVQALGARSLTPLNANTAAPPPAAAEPAVMQEIPSPTDKKADKAKAVATETAATTVAVVATEAAATTTAAAAAVTTEAAATTATAPPALQTGAAAGNGTSNGNGKGKGNGKGNGNKGNGNNNNNGNKNKGNHNNNNNNAGLGAFISSALSQLGLDGVLDASSIDKLSAASQISLLAQIVSLQTMKDLQMVAGQDIVVVLNQGFKSSGLNVVINA